jgi:hypothetical protein
LQVICTTFEAPPKRPENLFGLTTYSYTLDKSLSTIARYRFFDSSKPEKTLYNPPRTIRDFEAKLLFIIYARGYIAKEKEIAYVQVIHTWFACEGMRRCFRDESF